METQAENDQTESKLESESSSRTLKDFVCINSTVVFEQTQANRILVGTECASSTPLETPLPMSSSSVMKLKYLNVCRARERVS